MDALKVIDKTKLLPLYALRVGCKKRQYHIIRRGGYPAYQISFCTEGEGKFISGGTEHTIQKGDIFWFSPRVPHEYYPTASVWRVHWFVFTGDSLPGLTDYLGFHQSEVFSVKDQVQYQEFAELAERTSAAFEKEEEDKDLMVSRLLYDMLCLLGKCIKKQPAESVLEQNEHFKKLAPVLDYIRSHYRENINLEDMAAVLAVSKSYLCRIFNKTYEITPTQYLISLRLAVAKKLLISTDMKTNQIAREVGFNDTSYFCSTFRKAEGMTPEEFRHLHID